MVNEVKVVGKLSRTLPPVAPFADFHIPGCEGGGGGGGGTHEREVLGAWKRGKKEGVGYMEREEREGWMEGMRVEWRKSSIRVGERRDEWK